MDNKNEKYLNEEKYQNDKKKLIRISKIILILGLIIGVSFIILGIVKYNSVRENVATKEEVVTDTRTEEEIQDEIDAINDLLPSLKARKNQEFSENGFSEEYYRLDQEVSNKEQELRDLKIEKSQKNSGYNDVMDEIFNKKDEIEDSFNEGEALSKSMPFYIGAGFIIFISLSVSGFIFFIAKGRDIAAFTMQQTMPLAQEGAEKMTSTMKNIAKEMAPVYGDIAREVSKGIEKGKKQGQRDKCPGCGAPIDDASSECMYCRTKY